jgi:hypothetical protein
VTGMILIRVIGVALLAGTLAGCGEAWRTSTYDPRRACVAFGAGYRESDGTCRVGAP